MFASVTCLRQAKPWRHEDMRCPELVEGEPITLESVKQANGTVVYQKLEEAATKTGVPRAIACAEPVEA